MEKIQHTLEQYWICFGLLALGCVFAILHPELVLLNKSPMSGDPWTIKDPTVSWMAFMPSLREFRFELFEHLNVLWSNLRGLGQPMLGNGVQAAPLFPLTLIFIGLPDQLFWSVMPITRVLLIALGCFVLARRVFGLSFTASFVFAILAGLNLNVIRWINHPWSNGIVAGLWYLIFLYQVSFIHAQSKWAYRLTRVGLIVAVYSMVTCGFPEAAAAIALLVAVIFSSVVLANRQDFSQNWRTIVGTFVLCHLAGFCLSAPQIFALFEYIDFTGVMALRDNYISATYRPDEVAPYWLSQLTLLWESDQQHRFLNFSIGLFGLVLACKGLAAWLMQLRAQTATMRFVGLGFLLLMCLFVVKSFGWSTVIAWLFAHTPVLAQSHFPLYFSPLFYFGLAFFAANGVASYAQDYFQHAWQRIIDLVITALAMVAAIRLLELNVATFNGINRQDFWTMQNRGDGADFIWVFLLVSGLLLFWQLLNLKSTFRQKLATQVRPVIAILLITSIVFETAGTQRNRFAEYDSASLFIPKQARIAVQQTLQDLPVARHELRNNDHSGRFLELGIATIDNGISAMLPPNTRRVRRALYHTQYGGYYPLNQEKLSGSGAVLANNLQILPPQPLQPNWAGYQRVVLPTVVFLDWNRDIQQMRDNPLVLKGEISLPFTSVNKQVWVKLQASKQSVWLKADSTIDSKAGAGSIRLHWQADIASQWLADTQYDFTIRLVDPELATYQDSEPQSVVVHSPYPYAQTSRSQPANKSLARPLFSWQQSLNQWRVNFDSTALPRAYIAGSCKQAADELEATTVLSDLKNIRAGQVVLFANQTYASSELPTDFCDDYSASFERVGIIVDHGSRLQLNRVQGPGLLYLGDTHYPGWQAVDRINNQGLNIEPANLGMRAVFLPEAREYEVVFHYQPWWLNWAYLLILLAMLITAYLVRVPAKK